MRALIRGVLRIAFRIYFRRIHVRGASVVPDQGPLLLVANHPNSLVDPALLIHILGRPIYFGARHGLFRTPLGPVLRALGVIPLVRVQDDPGAVRQNLVAIDAYARLLGSGCVTAIFPEGVSQDSGQLAPVKSGAARIALAAEASRGFGLRLQIVPVGLQFEPRRRFRGEAFVRFGPPFTVRDLAALHGERPREAIRILTDRIEAAMIELAFHVDLPERLWLVDRLSDVYLQRVRMTGLPGTARSGLRGELRYRMAACLNYFSRTDVQLVDEVERLLRRYDRLRRAAGLRSRIVEEPAYLMPGPLGPVQAGAEAVAGFPPAFLGMLTSGLPYLLTRSVARRLAVRGRHPSSLSFLHIVIGAVSFPLVYALELLAASRLVPVTFGDLVVLSTFLPLAGLFALAYVRRLRKLAVHVSGRVAGWMKMEDLARVREAQQDLLDLMDQVRKRYQFEVFGLDDGPIASGGTAS